MNNKAHLLVIDDSPINLNLLGRTLESDYEVSVAISALEAMDIFAKELPDLILLDIMMPEMDGYQLIQAIKSNPQLNSIPVIFITAKNDEESELKGLQLGAVDFISKPINPAVVKTRIKNYLLLKQQQRQLEQERAILKTVVGSIFNGLVAYNPQGKIMEINLQMYQLWPRLNNLFCIEDNTIQQFFKQCLVPEIDPYYGDFMVLKTLLEQPEAIRTQGKIKLHNNHYYRFFSAPLRYKRDCLGFLLCFSNVTEETLLRLELEKTSITDELTGLYNRRHFNDIVKRELASALRHQTVLGLLIIDIDFFKKINDTWGHSMGDQVLASVADCMTKQLRQIDFCFRYGGEEFMVLLSNTDKEGILDTGKRLMTAVNQVNINGIGVSISIGAASTEHLPQQVSKDSFDALVNLADNELYRAKNNGRQRMHIVCQQEAIVLDD